MEALKIVDVIDEQVEKTEREAFRVTDLRSAEWVFRKLKMLDKEFTAQEEYVNGQIEYYQKYLKNLSEKYADDVAYFQGLLEAYVLEQEAIDPKFKLKTAQGTASHGKESYKWNYDDEKLMNFLKENDEMKQFVKSVTTEKIDKASLKKAISINNSIAVNEDGEVVDGIELVPYRNFNVKF